MKNVRWKMSDKKFIENNVHLTDSELAALLKRTPEKITGFRKRNGIKKPPRQVWNKGIEYHAGGRSIDTQFKNGNIKGQIRKTQRPIGAVFIRSDKGRKNYFIKLKENRQYSYSRYLYEQHHKVKLTKNDVVIHEDNDSMNINIGNLKLITRAENCKRNRNTKKGGESIRIAWGVHRTMTEFKVRSPYKWKPKKKVA